MYVFLKKIKNTNYINKSKETREEQHERKVEESRSSLEGGMDEKTKSEKEKTGKKT